MARNVNDVAAEQRRKLANDQRAATNRLAKAYASVITHTQRDLDVLEGRIRAARENGEAIDQSWLDQETTYHELLKGYRRDLSNVADQVTGEVGRLVQEALGDAPRNSRELWGSDRGIIRQAASVDLGPLGALLRERAGEHADKATAVLRDGIIRGDDPADIARALEDVTGGAFTNAAMVARTEQMRVYREATRQSLLSAGVTQWQWSARCNLRTCPYCWAMHGTIHSTKRVMGTHPNCLCVMVPVTPGKTGVELFGDLTEAEQEQVLGGPAFRAVKAGKVALPDLVYTGRHKRWGPVGHTRSLRDVLGPAGAAEFYAS